MSGIREQLRRALFEAASADRDGQEGFDAMVDAACAVVERVAKDRDETARVLAFVQQDRAALARRYEELEKELDAARKAAAMAAADAAELPSPKVG